MNAVDRLLDAIGYPLDEVLSEGESVVLKVDGREVRVRELRGRLVLSFSLGTPSEEGLRQLASFAMGRMLREEAVLAWDPERRELILWQSVPVTAAGDLMRRIFEVFLASCDWWADRSGETVETIPETMIRP